MSDELCVCGEPMATCPHIGTFKSAEEKAEHFANKPERAADLAHLRDNVIPQIERARLAELAGEAWDFAGYAGVDVPAPYKKLIGAIAFFGPLLKNMAGYDQMPQWFRDALEKVLEGADLANRTFE